MKKILIINGSRRKKTTYNLLKQIEFLMDDSFIIEYVNLGEINIQPCEGCNACITNGKCIIKDDYDTVMNKVNEADGIIIGTPVYLRNISGTLKNFIDRTCVYYHRTSIEGIPIMTVITTAYSGIKETNRYLSDVIVQWGAINGGTISRRATESDVDVSQKEIQKFIELLVLDKNKYKPSLKQVIEFNTQKILAVKILEKDLTYWEEKEWLNNNYFYQCKINIFKRIIAKMYFSLLMKVIPKVD